ncbi:uncharacterized protein LOC113071846 [Carassius auratus]|uniref:Uncharacterized protein LOC113071846 n=1 Tax=Carassius auratus TaxID=7957 RepID=A0A6P6MX72_CARAU|nr:uncharacterized protein LOC113071846 [Carassius auratus]
MKFRKPHWPPVISSEESEKRRLFRERLERKASLQATPSTRQSKKGLRRDSSLQATPSTRQSKKGLRRESSLQVTPSTRQSKKGLRRDSSLQATPSTRQSKKESSLQANPFTSPQWPPVISSEESDRRRRFRRRLERRSSLQATPSTSQQWPPVLKNVRVSVPTCASLAVLPPPSAVSAAALKRVPRATAWRRKKRAEEDKKALKQQKGIPRRADPKGYPCRLCGQPKRLEFGHSFFRGKSFCATAAGRTVSQWLSDQRRIAAADNYDNVPRTTAWRKKKKEEEIAQGLPQKRPKKCKPLTCSLCQQPKTKDYGHSRYGGKSFCSSYEGKTVELWLAEQRSLAPP